MTYTIQADTPQEVVDALIIQWERSCETARLRLERLTVEPKEG